MSLIKLIDSGSFFRSDEATVTVIDVTNSKGLTKQASDSRVSEFISSITPDSDKIFVHILAMGAGEYYGANRNADYFPEQNLIEWHKTFQTSPAHIFRNHVNKNPAIAIGQVIFSIYNQRMHRVEVIAWIDKSKAPDIVERVERGEFPATSMACKTPNDTCSICGNKAFTRQEYCEHLEHELGKVYPDGRKVMAINDAPLHFFDMSIVVRPADVTSSILQKVASTAPTMGSVDNALNEGVTDEGIAKQASILKLSEFIKHIDGEIVASSSSAGKLLDQVQDPDHKVIDILVNFEMPKILNTMAHLGISPSVTFLSELIGRKTLGESAKGIGSLAAGVIEQVGPANMELPMDADLTGDDSFAIATALTPYVERSSLMPEHVEKRAYIQNTNVGFVGNGPHIEPTAYELFRAKNLTENTEKGNLLKTLHILLTIGASALAAKWYITRKVEQKMKEYELNNSYGAKIHLVKSSSDLKVTYRLAKAAMVKVISGK